MALLAITAAGFKWRSFQRQSAIEAAREWARLAPLPVDISEVEIEVMGSPFTREFLIQFEGEPEAIAQWLKASPGPLEVGGVLDGQGGTVYEINPGGGAVSAKVVVGKHGKWVMIHTSWS